MPKRIVFDLIYVEVDFFIDLIDAWIETRPELRPFFAVPSPEEGGAILRRYPHLAEKGDFFIRSAFESGAVPDAGLMLTTEQYRSPLPRVLNFCCFHGQPAKGQTLSTRIDSGYDGYFLYGPIHRQTIETHYLEHYGSLPERPLLLNVGQTNRDRLLNGTWDKTAVLAPLGLDPCRPTVLYAPAFNEGASLREFGPELVARLCELEDCNILIKLAVDNYHSPADQRCNGGVDWFKTLGVFERFPHVRLYRDIRIDPALAAADVLVTDVSSVAFDFMLLGKPVVFVDTPLFWTRTLKRQFPHDDTASWVHRIDKNAGRDFGLIARDLGELPSRVHEALDKGPDESFALEMRKRLLYNPGRAIPHALKLLERFLESAKEEKPRKIRNAVSHNQGKGFLNASLILAKARASGLALNAYLESQEDTPKKQGHRDRIILAMRERGLFEAEHGSIVEIGAGTGRFMEKVLESKPARYEVYETAQDWCTYLHAEYASKYPGVVVYAADGKSLAQTSSNSCNLVHAHAVFVYLDFITTVKYLIETARVCKKGAYACFDCFYDTDWDFFTAECWIESGWSFPVVLSRELMEKVYKSLCFTVVDEFTEIYGASFSRYIILQKQ